MAARKKDDSEKADAKQKLPDRIKELEKELSTTKVNKRTEGAVGLLKAKIAKLKEKQEARMSSGKGGEGYAVRKTGDGSAILVGFPSVGKSSLLNAITNAKSEVGAYAFTTLTCIPGLLQHKHAKIQVLDVPGIVKGAAVGTGHGKEVLAVIRNADLCVFVIDVNYPQHLPILKKEVYDTNIRLNTARPDVKITRTAKGGIQIGCTCKLTKTSKDTIKAICREFKLNNADIVIRSNITADEFIDCLEDNKVYIPSIVVLNKMDMVTPQRLEEIKKETGADICISVLEKINLEELKDLIFDRLNLMRLFLKEPGKKADMEEPLIARKDSTIKQICDKLHKDFARKFKFARVTGKSAKFPAQKLSMHHVLMDGDILELHID